MPNVNLQHLSNEPPRQYPYHLLMITNYRLPPGTNVLVFIFSIKYFNIFFLRSNLDVDRCHLERHLENTEFEQIFAMNRMEFNRLPEWKRNELKKRVKLF